MLVCGGQEPPFPPAVALVPGGRGAGLVGVVLAAAAGERDAGRGDLGPIFTKLHFGQKLFG
jgi:hypothetical protein